MMGSLMSKKKAKSYPDSLFFDWLLIRELGSYRHE